LLVLFVSYVHTHIPIVILLLRMLKDDYFLPDNLCLVLVSTALPVLISLGSLPMEVQILLDLLELLSGGTGWQVQD
jgi:hypothetical protein